MERNYMIFDTSETGSIDFNEVLETSEYTLRLNISGSKTFVKWEGETIPTTVSNLGYKTRDHTHLRKYELF
jgi:hypothetical protein